MPDRWHHAGQLARLLRTGRLDRRALFRAAGAVSIAGPSAAIARRAIAATPEAGEALFTSRPREVVMQEILAAYPSLQRGNVPLGGSVILAEVNDLETVNPLVGGGPILGLVYEGLVGVHPVDGTIVPGLADFELAADGVTYVFRIHPEARFHDGVRVTAADAEFTLDTILHPAFRACCASSALDMVKTYRAVDERTFEMVTNGPVAGFLYEAVPQAVMPKHVWQDVDPADMASHPGSTGSDPRRVVGTGPFRFVERVAGDHTTFARHDDYWDRTLSQVPNLDEFVYLVLPDAETAVQTLVVGEVDVVDLAPSPHAVDELAETDGVAVETYTALNFLYYAYQLDPDKTPLFQERAVREALFVALDRPAIVASILDGRGEVALGTQPPFSPAYAQGEFAPYAYDPKRARALLAEAGWTDADGDGVVERGGERFSFSMLIPAGTATVLQLATYMQDSWAQVGVSVTLEPLGFSTVLDRVFAKDFELFLLAFSWPADPGQGLMFETDGSFNVSGYSNPEYDRLEIEQQRATDSDQRIDLIVQQAKIVWEDLPVGILAFNGGGLGYNARLKNVFPTPYSEWWSVPFWYLEG